MPRQDASFDWYSKRSREHGLPPRCPIASAELCPRYYESFALLGRAGIATKIRDGRAAALERKWKPFQSIVSEEVPTVTRSGEKPWSIHHFCPEVSYEIYGYFASDLHRFADEADRETAYERYERDGIVNQFDAGWASAIPRHYTECREYSIHTNFAAGRPSRAGSKRQAMSPQLRWQVLARDSFTCTYCGRRPPDVALEVDHRVSVRDGGSNILENLVTACGECNRGKGGAST